MICGHSGAVKTICYKLHWAYQLAACVQIKYPKPEHETTHSHV